MCPSRPEIHGRERPLQNRLAILVVGFEEAARILGGQPFVSVFALLFLYLRVSFGHELPDEVRRIDFPIVPKDIGFSQDRFGTVVEVDWNRGEIESDRIQNLA